MKGKKMYVYLICSIYIGSISNQKCSHLVHPVRTRGMKNRCSVLYIKLRTTARVVVSIVIRSDK